MNESKKQLSILIVGVGQELVERFASECGLHIGNAETYDDQASAIEALKGQRHFDLIVTFYSGPATFDSELLRLASSLDHRKDTPVVMLSPQARADFVMGNNKNKTGKRRRKRHGLTNQTKELAASALTDKVGYLQVKDFPNTKLFDNLLTRSYGPHKVIRCKDNELLLVTRGMVEVWHKQHDMLVKKLVIGALFGEMPLLGQTMVVTQAISGEAGAMIAVMNEEQVSQLIEAAPIAIAKQLYPRLAAAEADHYRARFQQVGPRLAALILNLAGKGTSIEGLTQRELGQRIGVLRETASVALADMKAGKLIAIKRKETIILDRKALEELSQM